MMKQTDYASILAEIKNNLQKQIAPFLKTLKQPQPSLGIGAGGDPIKQVDLAAEKAIVDTLAD